MTMEKFSIDYKDYGELVQSLVYRTKDLKPTCIYGLPRGGLPIAVHLSHYLKVPVILDLDQYQGGLLLVVDDIVDSGSTFSKLIEIAFEKKIEYKTASLLYKPCSSYIPDYFVSEVPSILWIVFPWERMDEECQVDQTFTCILNGEK